MPKRPQSRYVEIVAYTDLKTLINGIYKLNTFERTLKIAMEILTIGLDNSSVAAFFFLFPAAFPDNKFTR